MPNLPYWRLSAYYFAYFAFIGVFLPYFALYLQSLSFSAWDIGLLMSQMQLMRVVGPYFWGALADRLAQRVMIVRMSGAVALLAFSAFFFSSSFVSVLLTMSVLAFFSAASLPLVEALTFDHLREAPARYSGIRLWGSVGYIIAVMAAGIALDYLPIGSLLWANILALAMIVLCTLWLPEASMHGPAREAPPVGPIVRQPCVLALLAATFAMAAAHAALNIFFAIFLATHGYSKAMVAALFGLGVIAEIGVFLLMSRAMRRYSVRTILLASCAAAVVRFVMIGAGVDVLSVLLFAQVLHGLTFGACHSAAIAAINRWFPGATRSRGQALYASVSFGAGGFVGGLISGWSWDHLGGELTFALSSIYALIGLLLVAAWVREKDVGEPLTRGLEETRERA